MNTKQRRVGGPAWEIIERGARAYTIPQIKPRLRFRADHSAGLPPVRAIGLTVCDCTGVVIGHIERSPIHAPVDRGHLEPTLRRTVTSDCETNEVEVV